MNQGAQANACRAASAFTWVNHVCTICPERSCISKGEFAHSPRLDLPWAADTCWRTVFVINRRGEKEWLDRMQSRAAWSLQFSVEMLGRCSPPNAFAH